MSAINPALVLLFGLIRNKCKGVKEGFISFLYFSFSFVFFLLRLQLDLEKPLWTKTTKGLGSNFYSDPEQSVTYYFRLLCPFLTEVTFSQISSQIQLQCTSTTLSLTRTPSLSISLSRSLALSLSRSLPLYRVLNSPGI